MLARRATGQVPGDPLNGLASRVGPTDLSDYSAWIGRTEESRDTVTAGPIERLSRQPGRLHAPAVIAAAERLSEVLRRTGGE